MHADRPNRGLLAIVTALAAASWAGLLPDEAEAQSSPRIYAYAEGSNDWATMPYGRSWGAPSGVKMDPDQRSLWVLERCGDYSGPGCSESNLPPILKFNSEGKVVRGFGAGMLVFPHGMTVDREGNVWVTDGRGDETRGHQVLKFSPTGALLLALGQAGVPGESRTLLNRPSDVAIAPNGDIFVADGHTGMDTNMRIVKYSPDGTFIKQWGKKGSAPGELDGAHALAFDSMGRLFVADRGNNRIQIFDQEGTFLDEWTQFGSPSGLYITPDDVLYVADMGAGIRFGSAKTGAVTGWIKAESASGGEVRVAETMAVDANGAIYAGENANKMLTRFVLPK